MTILDTSRILAEIDAPSSPEAHLSALKAIKYEIIGNTQKKETWIKLGLVPPLVRTLSPSKANGKRRSRDANGKTGPVSESRALSGEEEIRLQATIIVGSLAQEGPAFATPLLQNSVAVPLLAALSPDDTPPRLVLASLRAINTVADALALVQPTPAQQLAELAGLVFSSLHIHSLTQILRQTSPTAVTQLQITLTAALITKLCRDERHQASLADLGVLDALATKMASFVVDMGFVLPGAEGAALKMGATDTIPPPAPAQAKLAPIMDAIGVIIHGSKLRAAQLLYSPAISAVFLISFPDGSEATKRPALPVNGSNGASVSLVDYLLPHVPIGPSKRSTVRYGAFPPLGSEDESSLGIPRGQSWLFEQHSDAESFQRSLSRANDVGETPLVAWLVYLARISRGTLRLASASVLTILYRNGLTNKGRETSLALLVVPLLVQMLEEEVLSPKKLTGSRTTESEGSSLIIRERAPAVLAMLVTDSSELQKAAVEAGAIKKLSQMLKSTYTSPTEPNGPTLWNPEPTNAKSSSTGQSLEAESLGEPGFPISMAHKLRIREGTLRALAALAPFKDEYRKMIIHTGVTPFIVDSLTPMDPDVNTDSPASGPTGNPATVLIAACGAVRALSRSVAILRTSLIDAGVSGPLFALLTNPDVEVQNAATAAVCNLVLEFSPMREAIMKQGVLKILCEHAHAANPQLRLNAMWALKHLVLSAENSVKKACFKQLGQWWLTYLICDEAERKLFAPEFERPTDDAHMFMSGVSADQDFSLPDASNGGNGDFKMADSIGALSGDHTDYDILGRHQDDIETDEPRSTARRVTIPMNVNAKLAMLREQEPDPEEKLLQKEIEIQEQGLGFIRNLICGKDAIEMIDFILASIGKQRLFKILASKLRPRVRPLSARRSARLAAAAAARAEHITAYPSGFNDSEVAPRVPPGPEIIVAVCFILVHIGAGHPRHRQMLTDQAEVLRLLLPLFDHPAKNVRVALTWIIINLTWLDDSTDQAACRARALDLKDAGFMGRLADLEADPELDVRERTKTAMAQMRGAIGM